MRLQSASALATTVLCCVVSAAPAQATPQQPSPIAQQGGNGANALLPNVLFDRIPGAMQTPAADWIRPGARLVFFSTNATTQSHPGSMGMKRDPNGNIIDDKGNRYRDEPPTGESGGGVGYTVVDVVAYEPAGQNAAFPNGVLVLQNHLYFLPQGKGGPVVHSGDSGYLIHPSGVDFFLHPRLLNQVPSVETQNVLIFRQGYELDGQTYRAMRVTIRNNGLASSVYDLTSGVMLFSRYAASGSQGQVLDRNGNIVNASATATGTHTFVSTRQMSLPWANGGASGSGGGSGGSVGSRGMPAWVRQTKKLKYSGQMISRSTGMQGLPDLSTALQAEIVTTQVGESWCKHEVTSLLDTNVGVPNVPSRTEIVTGPASIDGVWKDPNALRQLRTGQVIDQDQTIGTQTVVEFAGAGSDGKLIVAITTITGQQKATNVYDANDGRLIQMMRTETNPGTSLLTITQLNLVGVE